MNHHTSNQTIFALSSGRLPSAIGVVRVSGPDAGAVLVALCGQLPPPRVATLAELRTSEGEPIDQAIALWFPAPHSATGEDVAELQVHGGRAVVAALFAALERIKSLRPAEAGEFTRRAFENGKLDLTEAEGLDDLIHADTERQRRQALRQFKGLLGERARDWRQRIIGVSAMVEATIDFSDESDVPDDLLRLARVALASLRAEIEEVLAGQGHSERLRDGLVVAIAGPPNVGKSTLMNWLARREVAIVSPHAGTTRDVIEIHLDLGGYPVTVIDTAGIRDTADVIEQEGVRRAKARAADADVILWMIDSAVAPRTSDKALETGTSPIWVIRNKIDQEMSGRGETDLENPGPRHAISAQGGVGLAALVDDLVRFAAAHFNDESGLMSRARHRELLRGAAEALARSLEHGDEPELVAEEIRIAIHFLGRLLGRVDIEDILDSIFSDFCIGK